MGWVGSPIASAASRRGWARSSIDKLAVAVSLILALLGDFVLAWNQGVKTGLAPFLIRAPLSHYASRATFCLPGDLGLP